MRLFSSPQVLRSLFAATVFSVILSPALHAQSPTPTPPNSVPSPREAWGDISRGSLRSVLAPKYDIKLSSRAAGVVEKIFVAEGAEVKVGTAIMALDSQQEQAELAQAEAALQGIEAEYERVQSEFTRAEALFKDKISSDKQYDETRALQKITASHREQAKATVAMATVRLDNRTVRSPIDGVFHKTVKAVGEAVERFETIARVIDVSSLRCVIYADYTLLGRYAPGQQVTLHVQTSPQKQTRVEATVERVDSIIDSTSGTFRITIEVKPSADAIAGRTAMLVLGPNDSTEKK